jgi:hypothetical protein
VKASNQWNVQASDAADLLSVQQTRYAWQQTVEHAATRKMCELLLTRTDQQTVSIQTQEKQLAQMAHDIFAQFAQTTIAQTACMRANYSNMDTLMQSLLEGQLEIQSQLGRANEQQQEQQSSINMLYITIHELSQIMAPPHFISWLYDVIMIML